MNKITVKGDEVRILLQQGTNFDRAEMNKDFLALFLPRLQSFLMSNSDFRLTLKIIRGVITSIEELFSEEDAETH